MLLDFTVKNWMSYKDEATLSLVGTRERQHAQTLTKIPHFRSKKILPVAAIYGGNASGKTAILKAISCLKSMVVEINNVDDTISVEPFLLDEKTRTAPTLFDITFLVKDTVYRLTVEATTEKITYECLEILKENNVIEVYERNGIKNEDGSPCIEFNKSFFADNAMVDFVRKGTRDNQLFINNAVQQNIEELYPVYDWFNSSLDLVDVRSHAMTFAQCCAELDGFLEYAGDMLSQLDTGIVGLISKSVSEDNLPKKKSLKRDISQLAEGNLITLVSGSPGDYEFEVFIVRRIHGAIKVDRLRTEHQTPSGKHITFDLQQESSGTQRLMQLLPMLFALTQEQEEERVYVVDELDRSFHTMLTTRLIEEFLSTCNADSRKQLLFTTHDLLQMDQKLMRRDEMYIARRGVDGCSELVGLSEFEDIRYDKDLIRSYLDGRFGGVPMFS